MFFVKAGILLYSLPCFILYRRLKKVEAPFFSIMIKTRALPIMSHIHTEKLYLPNSGYISLPNL